VAYAPKGPLLDWTNLDLVDRALEAVERQAARLGCIYVKIDPDVREDTTTGRLVQHSLERRGWRRSADQVQFPNTAYSDLTGDEETVLAGMKQKWRYNIRLAEKRGLRVRQGGEADFRAFYALYAETGARDGFLIRPYDYYAQTWRTFLRSQAEEGNPAGGAMLLAEHPDDLATGAGPVAAICPTTFCSGKRCAGPGRRDAPSTTGGAPPPRLRTPPTPCRASGSSNRASAPNSNRISAPGTLS
jgi:hypothetical protein